MKKSLLNFAFGRTWNRELEIHSRVVLFTFWMWKKNFLPATTLFFENNTALYSRHGYRRVYVAVWVCVCLCVWIIFPLSSLAVSPLYLYGLCSFSLSLFRPFSLFRSYQPLSFLLIPYFPFLTLCQCLFSLLTAPSPPIGSPLSFWSPCDMPWVTA